jgi:hypothetical protein
MPKAVSKKTRKRFLSGRSDEMIVYLDDLFIYECECGPDDATDPRDIEHVEGCVYIHGFVDALEVYIHQDSLN